MRVRACVCMWCSQDCLWWVLYKAENVLLGSSLRKAALKEIMKHIHYEAREREKERGRERECVCVDSCMF